MALTGGELLVNGEDILRDGMSWNADLTIGKKLPPFAVL